MMNCLKNIAVAAALAQLSLGANASEVPPLPVTSPAGHFEFHSDPWLNLHHFLYHWSRAHDAREQILRGRVKIEPGDLDVDLGEDKAAWDAASAAYLQFVERGLLGGEGMRQLKVQIAEGPESWPEESPFTELKAVMPIYRQYWWPRHSERNRELVATLMPLLEAHEAQLAEALAEAYESGWPDGPINAYVSYYTNWAGAYTSWGPNLIMLASSREEMHGPYGLEILFHEAGHTVPLGENVRPVSQEVAQQVGVDEGGVWHALLFHITGEAARKALGSGFVPYAQNFGLWDRGSWKGLHPIIRAAFTEASDLRDRLRHIHEQRAATP